MRFVRSRRCWFGRFYGSVLKLASVDSRLVFAENPNPERALGNSTDYKEYRSGPDRAKCVKNNRNDKEKYGYEVFLQGYRDAPGGPSGLSSQFSDCTEKTTPVIFQPSLPLSRLNVFIPQ